MAVNYNTGRIITDGLVLALDAGNNKSHSSNRFISYGTGLTTQGIGFQVNGDGTFQRVAAGTVIGGYTVKTTDVVYSYALGSNGCHYHGNDISIPAGVYATFSFDYLVTGATNYPSADFLASFENALSNSIATANNLQNAWQRRSFTSGPTGSAGTLRMLLYPGGCGGRLADSGTIYFRNPKVEWVNVDTGDGNFSSMSNLTTWYDMSGNGNNGTLTNGPQYYNDRYFSFSGNNDFMQANVNTTALDGDPSLTVDMFVRRRTGTNIGPNQAPWGFGGTGQGNGVGGWTPTTNLINLDFYDSTRLASTEYYPEGQFVHIVWTKNGAGAETSNVKCYVNGVERALTKTRNATRTNQFNTSTNGVGVVLGRLNGNATDFHAPVDVSLFKVYTRALTAQEIQQNFNALRSRFSI